MWIHPAKLGGVQVWRQVADTEKPDIRVTVIRQVGNCPTCLSRSAS